MSVDGKWNITINSPMGPQKATLDLKADGGALSGTPRLFAERGGTYLADCAISDEHAPWAMNPEAARCLWALSEQLVGESPAERLAASLRDAAVSHGFGPQSQVTAAVFHVRNNLVSWPLRIRRKVAGEIGCLESSTEVHWPR